MKLLMHKPLLMAFLLSLPLWIVFNNFIVALVVSLLVAFLISMGYSLYLMKKRKNP